jgi:signal transduction histidine kinase
MYDLAADIRTLLASPPNLRRAAGIAKRYGRALAFMTLGWVLALSYLFYDYTIYDGFLLQHLYAPPFTYELLFHVFMVLLSPPLFLYLGLQDYRKTRYLLELETMTEKWRATYDSVPDVIFILDREHRVTDANRTARMRLGEDLVGKPFCYSRITGAPRCGEATDAPADPCPHRVSLDRNAPVQREVRDGAIYDATCTPVLGSDGEIIGSVNVLKDVTEKRLLEAQFLQAQKIESLGRFSAAIAHDFNNLLTVIQGSLAMIAAQGERSAAALDQARKAAERGAHLVRSITTFSRKSVTDPCPFDLDALLLGFDPLLRHLLGKDVRFELRPEARGLKIRGSAGGIEQVLMNLATNARDAMPKGGVLTIGTRPLVTADGLRYGYAGPEPAVLLQVSDTGSGMSDAVRGRLFEPFFTTKEPGKGTGLGLSTVYGIVRQHGGSVQVQTEPGVGTTFSICLPAES